MKKAIIAPEGNIRTYSNIVQFVKRCEVGQRLYFGADTGENCNYIVFDENYRYLGEEDCPYGQITWLMRIEDGFIIFADGYGSNFWWFTEDPLSLSYTYELKSEFVHEQTKRLSIPSTAYCGRKWKVSEYGDDKELEYLMKGFISHDLSEIDISSRHKQWDTEVEIEGEEPLSIPIEIKWHRIPVVNNPFAAQSIEDMMWCILVVDEDRGKFILDPGKYDPNLSDD